MNDTPKHSPAPWQGDAQGNIYDDRGDRIATVIFACDLLEHVPEPRKSEITASIEAECEANWNTFLAAPDLLAACQAQQEVSNHTEVCDECASGMECEKGSDLTYKAATLRRSALKKAKGQQA